eukprot:6180696-Pleurochrysis_carterae.AAC.2
MRNNICYLSRLQLLSAADCLALVVVHTYWIHGSRALNVTGCTNPLLVYHNVFSAVQFLLHLTQQTGRRAALQQVAGRGHLGR